MQVIPEEKIHEIVNRINIIDFISSYTQLKRSGQNYKGLCIFHKEKTPSFIVNPHKGLWKCFGCGEGGNIFTFIMKLENITFPEAVRKLANVAGVSIEYSQTPHIKKELSYREKLFLANEFAHNYFKSVLYESEEGKKFITYLAERSLKNEEIKSFGFGASSSEWNSFYKALLKKEKDVKEFLDLGLLIKNNEKIYDRFRDRLIIPIYDETGKLVAFAGRTLNDDTPKYINSPESKIFQKGNILYGLHLTKNFIKEKGYLILVEGYFDFISLYKEGIRNVVASMGTSLTENQINIIKRFTERVVIAYDSDFGGQNATLRGIDLLHNAGVEIAIVKLPAGYDPDKFIRERGIREWEDLVAKAQPFFDYCIEFEVKTVGGIKSSVSKNKCIENLIERLILISNPIIFDDCVKKLAEYFDVNERDIRRFYLAKKNLLKTQVNEANAQMNQKRYGSALSNISSKVEIELLKCLLQDLSLIEKVKNVIAVDDFEDEKCKALYSFILQNSSQEKITTTELLKYCYISDDISMMISELVLVDEFDIKLRDKIFEEIVANFLKMKKKRKILSLKKHLKTADESERNQILSEISQVKKEIIGFK